jgi:large subunit ribosomal protein L32
MAHPKSRISKQRKRKRRTHYKIEAPNVVNCGNCGAPKLTHHMCDECGYYRGRPIVDKTVVEEADFEELDFGDGEE